MVTRAFTWISAEFEVISYLSPEQSLRLMTFDPAYKFPSKARQQFKQDSIGNAVPPAFSEKVVRAASLRVD